MKYCDACGSPLVEHIPGVCRNCGARVPVDPDWHPLIGPESEDAEPAE